MVERPESDATTLPRHHRAGGARPKAPSAVTIRAPAGADHVFRTMLEQIDQGAVALNSDGTVAFCNRRMAAMLEVPPDQVIGRTLQSLVVPDERDAIEQLLDQVFGGPTSGEFTIRAARGTNRTVRVALVANRHRGDTWLCGVVTDLSEQKRHDAELSQAVAGLAAAGKARTAIEDSLRQSQKMAAIGQITGGLVHDFNNLLAVVMGALDMIGSNIRECRFDQLQADLTAAMASARRATAVTQRLLTFARRQAPTPRPLRANDVVGGMAGLLRSTLGPAITLETALAPDAGTISCDPSELDNALLNLAINARDAMPDGGTLTIGTGNVELDAAGAASFDVRPGPYIALSIADTGSGMPDHVIARAFDPFFTTKPAGQGTGLGLSTIHGFARQAGGQVRIRSAETAGTTITIILPRHADAGPAVVPPQAPPPALQGGGETILVVDDEPELRVLFARMLRRLGYAVLEAGTGNAALHLLEAGPAIDLLITDIGLPGGMSGRQLADAARASHPTLKILFTTGFGADDLAEATAGKAGIAVMTKPFEIDVLAETVRSMIGVSP